MSAILNFFQSPSFLAFLISTFIFLLVIFLVIKRWINFPVTLLLLFVSLTTGLLINHQESVNYFQSSSLSIEEESQNAFHAQVLQAIENLKAEVNTEKENLRLVMNQVQEIFDSMEIQKQELQHFIEETRERFKKDYPMGAS